jgi:hypothetical protein
VVFALAFGALVFVVFAALPLTLFVIGRTVADLDFCHQICRVD